MRHLPFLSIVFSIGIVFCSRPVVAGSIWDKELDAYTIAWTNQSSDSSGSMPLAGGDLGLNVWVENGDLLFLMGSPNCMNENGMQVKLGRVRLHFTPAVFDRDFRQELRLKRSEVVVSGRTASGAPVSVTLWCATDKPVVHVELSSGDPVAIEAAYETWSSYEAKFVDGGLQWVRRLPEVNARREHDLKAQGMAEFTAVVPDPLGKLTLGGRLTAPGLESAGTSTGRWHNMTLKTTSLRTKVPVKSLDLCLTMRMEQDKTLGDWEAAIEKAAKADAKSAGRDRRTALAWWREFWGRSHISVNPGWVDGNFKSQISDSKSDLKSEILNLKSRASAREAWSAARNYQLFRYQLAANRNGRAMTLFNGGIFPCEGNPDGRMWDGCQFMAQNQRPMAWAELKTGDWDLLKVSLDFYRDRTEMSRLHAKKFWGVEGGVAYSEAFSIFGLDAIGTTADGRCAPRHLNYHYTSGMEFALIMLEYGRFTGQDIRDYLAPAEGIIRYYDQYYQKRLEKNSGKPLDENGQLVIYPSDACEPYHGCTNNVDVICGLEALSQAQLDLPAKYLTPEKRAYFKEFQKRIPPLTIAETKEGKKYVAAAKSYEWVFYNGNMDFPNMYICFPFNHFFLGRPGNGMELANNTWEYGPIRPNVQHQAQCWYQSVINLARLGRTADAKKYALQKLVKNPSLRFPAFWTNYGFCHAPDTDHGATAMIGLQEMIMQTDGRRILLGAAWPAEWNCDFKLCAPYQTTVEGRVVEGKVVVDKVTPKSRCADIEIYPLKVTVAPAALSEGKPTRASSCWGGGYDAGKACDGSTDTRWAAARDKQGWLEVDLGKPEAVGRIVIQETSYPRVSKFAVEAQQADGSWKVVAEGGRVGACKEIRLSSPATAQKFRLNILDSSEEAPTVDEFQLFTK